MSQSPEISDDASPRKRKLGPEVQSKKRKRTRASQEENIYTNVDEAHHVNLSFAQLDPNLLADHIAKKQRRFDADATALELEERRLPASAFLDTTTQWTETRTLDKLPAFLRQIAKSDLKKAPTVPGSPHTLVIAGAGLRAADITRALREFQTPAAKVAKLFAKHIKLSESVEMLQRTRISIGVGTPARLAALLGNGALKADRIVRIVVDVSHVDQKKRGILDMKETLVPLLDLLNREELKSRIISDEGRIDLAFY